MNDLAPSHTTPVEWGDIEEPRVPQRLYALKDRDTFIVADSHGDIAGAADGLFHDDTRILSRWELTLGDKAPTLLSGAISQDNVYFTSHGLNRAIPVPSGPAAPPGVVHLERKRFLWDERLYERIRLTNYSTEAVDLPVVFRFAADFHDMFEVRGARRRARGRTFPPEITARSVRFGYEGLDRVARASVVSFSDAPVSLNDGQASFQFALQTDECREIYVEVGAAYADAPSRERFRNAAARARYAMRERRRQGARISSNGRLFNAWIDKSRSDLALLTTPMKTGPYPYAGIPWFSTCFGRDGIITAWQILWFDPALAKGVLSYLAEWQAHETSAFRDSEPGKIMHETRRGEMSALGEIPFGRYYGGVDTTPLFVALAGAYAERTGDYDQLDRWWPALERAAGWIVAKAEQHPLGLIAYARGMDGGLTNQGWKDSGDSIFHADGRFPEGPVALVEVQGYAYAAYRTMAAMTARRGDSEGAERWSRRATALRAVVEERFWMPEHGFYGIALDGQNELCRVLGSNPGHLLFTGLPRADRGAQVARRLFSSDFFSGWGLRTLATGQPRFNPMSYHNGSVWPHDTALTALGLSYYGERAGVVKLTAALFETATQSDMRLPELFCGFPRAAGEPPVAYPVACLPQAWAAGAVFMLLQACLGLSINGQGAEVDIRNPTLPIGIDRLSLDGLQIGDGAIDLTFERQGSRVAVHSNSRGPRLRVRYG
ncbi:MAG: amylo-alpha-1,6-glucosidase [Alphaproteobacteria bacterium]|nr:amylo-alpha-1,6-glucosidase [Alphaproteobacteria bacterium]MBU1514143.1 amylo-alpha-1,6-glucosidase [Alphaproteobacteria bacterium]MBU2096208.1 amylo-alpha-1,6-glucosidase [Alphaproteobacteria bacterium]MBU2151162.1 amylo-alpha-1,6-glucosidase [Alphaproteobacteria bacterium]MBU2307179.1 amylo-alpha-1,6-glucosidase [Alphaproteobacteria bacterium]